MDLKTKPSRFCGNAMGLRQSSVLVAAVLVFVIHSGTLGWSQVAAPAPSTTGSSDAAVSHAAQARAQAQADALEQWQGLPVRRISFAGVPASRLDPLPGHLAQAEGAPLNPDDLRKSLRQLFATGLYETIDAAATRLGDGVALTFQGTARTFIGTVSVDGAKGG